MFVGISYRSGDFCAALDSLERLGDRSNSQLLIYSRSTLRAQIAQHGNQRVASH